MVLYAPQGPFPDQQPLETNAAGRLRGSPRTTMTQNYQNLCAAVEACRDDVEKATSGNKAATARVRKAMQDIKNLAQEIRKEMLELRDAGA